MIRKSFNPLHLPQKTEFSEPLRFKSLGAGTEAEEAGQAA